jgi:FAD/FMN-containing dehydrogenase
MLKLPPISQLQSTFIGKVIGPDDVDYDKAREVFYGGIDSRPAVIIQVAHEEDVVKSIKLAQETELALAVRSGGHSFAGHSSIDGGIVLDLRQLKTINIDSGNETVWAGAGLTAGELTWELDKHGFVVGFGDTGSVGIGGITLGGGVGFLVRKYGLTIDNLLAAKIVTVDGQVLEINEQQHPDLFWAIRGGGGNFGVVTQFKFKLHKLNQAVGGMLFLPASAENIVAFMKEAEKAPTELSGILNIMSCPPMPFVPAEHHGKLVMMAMLLYAGNTEAGEKVLVPFRTLAKPIADMLKTMRYAEMFPKEEMPYHPKAVAETMFMKDVDLETAKIMMTQLEASDAPMRAVQLRVLGGAMTHVASDATAFAHRTSKIMANVAAFFESDEEKSVRQEWVTKLAQSLNQGDSGAYVNFLGPDDKNRLHDAYPEKTWNRLVAIKRTYDPTNIFRINHNIQPA